MRILITEEALESGNGHWPNYIGTIAGELRDAGDEVDILTHIAATEQVVSQIGGTRVLRRNCWTDPASNGSLGGIQHNFSFLADLKRWLTTHDPYDYVCALTMRLQHLLAFALLSRSTAAPPSTRFLLLFVQGFGRYVAPGRPSVFPRSPSAILARLCFRLLRPAVLSGRVILAAETGGMKDELERFTRLPVTLFPHPAPPPPKITDEDSTEAVTITCPGIARHEKGSDLFQSAAKTLLSSPDRNDFRFVMQWPEPFEMPDGTTMTPDSELITDDRVEFINHNLDTTAYEKLLARTDIIVLPYRQESYHHRVSRVAIEAAARGIPLVYMNGTWPAEVTRMVGDGTAIEDETISSVVAAIRKALEDLPSRKSAAYNGAGKVAEFYSARHFRELLATAPKSLK